MNKAATWSAKGANGEPLRAPERGSPSFQSSSSLDIESRLARMEAKLSSLLEAAESSTAGPAIKSSAEIRPKPQLRGALGGAEPDNANASKQGRTKPEEAKSSFQRPSGAATQGSASAPLWSQPLSRPSRDQAPPSKELQTDTSGLSQKANPPDLSASLSTLEQAVRALTQKVGTVREESTWVAALEPLERLVGELSHTLALISGREQDSQQKVKIVEFGKSDRRQSTLQPTRPGNSPQPHDISNATRLHTSPNAISGFGRKMENSRSADERNSVSPDGFRDQSAVLAKIEEAIESLATKIEEITRDRDQSQYEALSQRIDDLRQELIQRIADAWFAPDTKPLEDLLNGISEKLDYAQATSGERRAIEAVEEQLAELTDRFDRASANIPSLVSIQASILELFSEMEKTRDVALEAAENAVRNVLEEAAGRPHSADLESQIQTLRNLQEEDDQRTLSVLTTIHRVLETLTNRLARVEDELSARHAELPDLGIRSDEGGPAFDGLMRERAGGQDHKSGSSDRLAAARLAGRAAEGAKSRDSAIDRPGSHGLLHRLSKLVGP